MIELPDDPAPNGAEVSLLDYGMVLRPATGAAVLRVNRAGSRYRVAVSYPPMTADEAGQFVARFQKAKREGLKIDFPLLDRSQGAPGTPLVDGANPTGTTLPVKGLTPGYTVKEGYWLTLIDADGNGYLHCATAAVRADDTGAADLTIEPPIRAPLPDEAVILLGKPTVEGVLVEDIGWSLGVDKIVRGATVVIEEAA